MKVEYLLRGMALLNYDAINLGEKDLQYGRDFLEQKRRELDLPFISANVYNYGTQETFVKPYVIKEVNGVKIGIFGVTLSSPLTNTLVRPESGLEIREPIPAAKALVPALRKKCDVIIALSHLSLNGSRELATAVEGIDIIVSGHDRTIVREPTKVGNTVIMQPGAQGKYLGQIDFDYTETGVVIKKGQAVALNDQIPDNKQQAELVAEYDEAMLHRFPMESPTALDNYSKLSERTCMGCHRKEYQQWNSTAHSHAWQSLVVKNQTGDAKCQQCHTTMFGEEGGFTTLRETPFFVNVQCAACHQLRAGSVDDHIKRVRLRRGMDKTNGQTERDFSPVTETSCLKCHTNDASPDFEFETALKKVTH